jgi:hypothetical protein
MISLLLSHTLSKQFMLYLELQREKTSIHAMIEQDVKHYIQFIFRIIFPFVYILLASSSSIQLRVAEYILSFY